MLSRTINSGSEITTPFSVKLSNVNAPCSSADEEPGIETGISL